MGKVNVREVSGARMWAMVAAGTSVSLLAVSKYMPTESLKLGSVESGSVAASE